MIYRLYLKGEAGKGPMGVKEVTKTLNGHGLRTRLGTRFGVASVHRVLTNPVYAGRWRFNKREAKTGKTKAESEVIEIAVPPVIETAVFDKTQASLKARDPRVLPPRVVTGPILLTGLAVCATCGGAMTLRTCTSSTIAELCNLLCTCNPSSAAIFFRSRANPFRCARAAFGFRPAAAGRPIFLDRWADRVCSLRRLGLPHR